MEKQLEDSLQEIFGTPFSLVMFGGYETEVEDSFSAEHLFLNTKNHPGYDPRGVLPYVSYIGYDPRGVLPYASYMRYDPVG